MKMKQEVAVLPYKYLLSANNKVLLVYFAFRKEPAHLLSSGNYLWKDKSAAYLPNTLNKKKVKVLNSDRIVYY